MTEKIKIPAMTGAKLQAARLELGLTQPELAKVFGCSESTISRLERTCGPVDGVYVCAMLYLKTMQFSDYMSDELRKALKGSK